MGVIQPGPMIEPIELANEPEFDLGTVRVKPAERAIVLNGDRRELQPRVMQVLVALAKARPAVVSRDKLIELCWEGRVVGDDALNRCILALRHMAQEFAPTPFAIETVPRIGHRLIEDGQAPIATSSSARSKPWRVWIGAAVLLLVLAGGIITWRQRSAEIAPASIAVLPFRNLGTGDPYFAEGIGEEILALLADDRQFRVAGSSSSSDAIRNADPQDVARRLRVEYVVEGTVRTQGDRVRVNAHLLRVRDGSRLWAESYDGTLDDVFAIQRRIGTSIASALSRKLVAEPAPSGPLLTDGKAYNLYLTARGLIRTRARRSGPTAVDLLRDAIQIDSGYAPAWASLGEATLLAGGLKDMEGFVTSTTQAQEHARHALRLDPDLPEAHRALGGLLGFGTPSAVAHLRRAAQLEPNNAENMIGLGTAYGASGEFEKELAAYRRAWELDPLWFRTVSSLAVALSDLGERAEAEAFVNRALPGNGIERSLVLAKIASSSGDLSEAARRWSIVIGTNSPRWSNTARRDREEVGFVLGLRSEPLALVPRPLDQRHLWRVSMINPPSREVWRLRNRNPVAAIVYRDENLVAAKLMLNAGRWRELAAAYDGPGGLAGVRRGERLRADQIGELPVLVEALRAANRDAEANHLLGEAEDLIDEINLRGRVPFWFDADAAGVYAAAGRKHEAVSRLVRAFNRGWRHCGATDLRQLADEPAYRSLRETPMFQRLQGRLDMDRSREREETIDALMKVPGLRAAGAAGLVAMRDWEP